MLKELQTILETMLNKNIILLFFSSLSVPFRITTCRKKGSSSFPCLLPSWASTRSPTCSLAWRSSHRRWTRRWTASSTFFPESATTETDTLAQDWTDRLCFTPYYVGWCHASHLSWGNEWSTEHTPAVRILSMLATASYSGKFLLWIGGVIIARVALVRETDCYDNRWCEYYA